MVILLMGVTGCGKTAVGELLAAGLGWDFYDGDDFHPPENVEKMRAGRPLEDEDRYPWLALLAGKITECTDRGSSAVLACSALKADYRDILVADRPEVRLVHLKGPIELISRRLQDRVHRYMPASLLESQFATLEEPREALVVSIAPPPELIVQDIRRRLAI